MISKPLQQRLQRSLRLSSCVAAILAAANPASATALADAATPLDALARRISNGRFAAVPGAAVAAFTAGAVVPVTSCADDAGFDTLRHAVLVANPGDTVDLSALTCSKITLQNGAIDVAAADLTIAGPGRGKLTIDGAKAGRVFKHGGLGTLTLNDVTVSNGKVAADAAYGGCIYSKGSVSLNRAAVNGCEAAGQTKAIGGAIVAFAQVTARNSELSSNKAIAAVGADATLSAAGGGVFAVEKLQLYGSVMSGNLSAATLGKAYGGGSFSSALSVKYSTISGNEAAAAGDAPGNNYSLGGAAISSGDAQIFSSTIDHNTADAAGAFVFLSGYGTVSISQSTISSNTGKLGVGAMSCNADVSIFNSTIAFNVSGSLVPVGIQASYGMAMQSTIVADNPPLDIAVETITGSHNLIKNAYAATVLPMDTITLDPQLGPLALHGGATQTHAIGANSPALNSGANPANYPKDQRGPRYRRAVGVPDIGAFEYDADHIFGDGVDLK